MAAKYADQRRIYAKMMDSEKENPPSPFSPFFYRRISHVEVHLLSILRTMQANPRSRNVSGIFISFDPALEIFKSGVDKVYGLCISIVIHSQMVRSN